MENQMKEKGTNFFRSFARKMVILFVIFFALTGFGMRYLQKGNDENATRLANEGVTSLATITRKTVDTSHNTNRQASGIRHYILKYSFHLEDSGKKWQGDDDVSEEEYDSVEVGDQFDVRYWPQNPDISTILEGSYAAGAQLAKTISTTLFILAILLVLILLIRPLKIAFNL